MHEPLMFLLGLATGVAYFAVGVAVNAFDWMGDYDNPRIWPGLVWPVYLPGRWLGFFKRKVNP